MADASFLVFSFAAVFLTDFLFLGQMLGCLPLSLDASCSADIVTSPFGRDVQDHLAVYSVRSFLLSPRLLGTYDGQLRSSTSTPVSL